MQLKQQSNAFGIFFTMKPRRMFLEASTTWIEKADDLIAAIEGVTDQFEDAARARSQLAPLPLSR